MAQKEFSIDLQNTFFPFLSGDQGRTVVNPSFGESSNPPSLAYCHNVMPTKEGYVSVGFEAYTTLPTSDLPDFVDVRPFYGDNARGKAYIAFDTNRQPYILRATVTYWVLIGGAFITSILVPGNFDPDTVTVATVNGISYIHFALIGSMTIDEVTGSFTPITLTGLTASALLGLVSSFGYLVAYTAFDIAWSSTIDPTDFVPSSVTGAGGGSIQDIAGKMQFVTSNDLGLLIYAEDNVVAAVYTGNPLFPWKYREVRDSKGGIDLDQTAYEANSGIQFAYTKAGLQSITPQRAQTILPEVTDFLAGSVLEDFNTSTLVYDITTSDRGMVKRLSFISSRYLVISYGISSFTHAIIFDTVLEKLGKIKLDHVAAFEFTNEQENIERKSIAFLQADTIIQLLEFSKIASSSGVLILGKLQDRRNHLLTLHKVEVENKGNVAFEEFSVVDETGAQVIDAGNRDVISLVDNPSAGSLAVYSQVSLDGVSFSTVAGTLVSETADLDSLRNLNVYAFRADGKNHSIVLVGMFDLSTLLVLHSDAGSR